MRDTVQKLMSVNAEEFPAYQSVKGCIEVSRTSERTEQESD